MEVGSFIEAVLSFEKAIYLAQQFSETESEIADILLLKANAYAEMTEYELAIKQLERVNLRYVSDSVLVTVRVKRAYYHFLLGEFYSADAQFKMLDYNLRGQEELYLEHYYLRVLILNALLKTDEAKEMYTKYIAYLFLDLNKRELALSEMEEVYCKKCIPKVKDPEKAMLISTFFPGFGQLYAGKPSNALGSMALLGGSLVYIAVGIFVWQTYFTSAFLGSMLYQSFHEGGKKNAFFLAEQKNYLNAKRFNEDVKTALFKHMQQASKD